MLNHHARVKSIILTTESRLLKGCISVNNCRTNLEEKSTPRDWNKVDVGGQRSVDGVTADIK